jgi:hypothetical protein
MSFTEPYRRQTEVLIRNLTRLSVDIDPNPRIAHAPGPGLRAP